MSQKRKLVTSVLADDAESSGSEYHCQACSRTLATLLEFNTHLESKQHKKNKEIMEQEKRIADKCSLFIKGFSSKIKQESILQYFKQFGDIISANFVHNFLFLDYTNPSCAQKVLKQSHFLEGNRIFVSEREQRQNPKVGKLSEDTYARTIDALKAVDDFESEVVCALRHVQPNFDNVRRSVAMICEELFAALRGMSPRVRVHNFGSTVTGLQLNFSDLDVFVGGVREAGKNGEVNALYKFKHRLVGSRRFANAFVIPNAKIPILKCVHVASGINVDVNVKNMLGVRNSQLLNYYAGLHGKVRALLVVLKFWMKTHKLTGQNHLFTNYSLCLMFVFYLQQRPYCLPSVSYLQSFIESEIHDGWNANFSLQPNVWGAAIETAPSLDIIKGFFEFYLEFPYAKQVVCPFLGYAIDKTAFEDPNRLPEMYTFYKANVTEHGQEPLHVNSTMCLQDPFEHNRNTTRILSSVVLENFLRFCELGKSICGERKNVLQKLLTNVPADLKKTITLTPDELLLTISMWPGLTYLKQSDKSAKGKEWFKIVCDFIRRIMSEIFRFKIEEQNDSKNLKSEGQSDVHDKVSYVCTAKLNFWDNRKATEKALKDPGTGIFERQIQVTDQLCQLYKHLQNSEDVIKFEICVNLECEAARAHIQLKKISAYKKSFKSFCLFVSGKIPSWFEAYEKELCLPK